MSAYGTQYAQPLPFEQWEIVGGCGKTNIMYEYHDRKDTIMFGRTLARKIAD